MTTRIIKTSLMQHRYDVAMEAILSKNKKARLSLKEIDEYLALAEDEISIVSCLLEIKNNNFTRKQIERYEQIKLEKRMGIRSKTITEYKKEFSYTVDNDEITITSYKGDEVDVIIPEAIGGRPVVRIGETAFSPHRKGIRQEFKQRLTNIRTVFIPDTVKYIEDYAFLGCFKLERVNMSNNLVDIGNAAFSYCTSLEKITIPESVDISNRDMFFDCWKLEDDEGLVIVNGCLCKYLDNLLRLEVPRHVKAIGKNSIDSALTFTVTIHDNVTYISDKAFYNINPRFEILTEAGSYASKYCARQGIKCMTI